MINHEILQSIFGWLFAIIVYVGFFFMYFRAITKHELLFHGGIIRGRLARVLGVIGLSGITAGAYLAISTEILHLQEPPGFPLAVGLFILFVVMGLTTRFLSIFFWHS